MEGKFLKFLKFLNHIVVQNVFGKMKFFFFEISTFTRVLWFLIYLLLCMNNFQLIDSVQKLFMPLVFYCTII